ncbi:MAG: hypothetical protein RBT15_03470 [Gudongella sp.]|jgi:hypothetical protein|nr:hypothetical protein [Gudongella sp.]
MSINIEKYDFIRVDERYKKELSKLRKLFKDINTDRKKLVERLIENAAFMHVLLQELQVDIKESGYKEEYQNGPNQFGYKRSIAVDLYQVTIKNYATIIKQLNSMIPEPVKDGKNDASDILEFIASGRNKNSGFYND